MDKQDKFYLDNESNAFFDRWWESQGEKPPTKLRKSKKEILEQLLKVRKMKDLKVLEIGCFISDLLSHLHNDYDCDIYGIESSNKACQYAKKHFSINIENATFAQSKIFNLDCENQHRFDIIICDDVLSWMSRDLILSSLGVIDWMLKPGGSIFLRDFSPTFGFAFENHHWPGENIYNFKQPGGHREFFLKTGKYLEVSTYLRNDAKYQKVGTGRVDSMIWADSILTKINGSLYPIEILT